MKLSVTTKRLEKPIKLFTITWAIFILFSLLVCQTQKPESESELASLVPDPSFAPNWRQDGEALVYNTDNLTKYIHGQAGLYLDYGFKELYSVNFRYRERPDETLTVDVYDMDSPLHAWGLYAIMRRPGFRFQEMGGAEAVVATFLVRFAKNSKLVTVSTQTKAEHIHKDMVKMATLIAERIKPVSSELQELLLLPKEGQIEHTIKYVVKGFLGQTFLPPVVEASYTGSNDRFGGFVIPFASPDSAASGLEKLRSFVESKGEIKSELSELGTGGFWGYKQYYGNFVVTQRSKYIVGLHHADDRKQSEELLAKILDRVGNGSDIKQ